MLETWNAGRQKWQEIGRLRCLFCRVSPKHKEHGNGAPGYEAARLHVRKHYSLGGIVEYDLGEYTLPRHPGQEIGEGSFERGEAGTESKAPGPEGVEQELLLSLPEERLGERDHAEEEEGKAAPRAARAGSIPASSESTSASQLAKPWRTCRNKACLRRFADEPVAEIVQCGEPIFSCKFLGRR